MKDVKKEQKKFSSTADFYDAGNLVRGRADGQCIVNLFNL
jgi:hypothetical protein